MRYHVVDFLNYTDRILLPSDLVGDYRYCIEFRLVGGGGMIHFHEVRKWLVEMYEWSDQVSNKVANTDNKYWTWRVMHDSYTIYLHSDKEFMLFKLKFPINNMV